MADGTPKREGHAEFLLAEAEDIVAAMRQLGGLPSIADEGYLAVSRPPLLDLARTCNAEPAAAPGSSAPSGVVKFLD